MAESRGCSVLASETQITEDDLSATAVGISYENSINYQRAPKGAAQLCVMCGASSCKNGGVVIPRQNKDVCRDCDKALWKHRPTGAFFKWCKGCKNFLQIGSFSQKLDAAKCDRCRARGRSSYLLKKRTAGGSFKNKQAAAPAPPRPPARGDSVAAISLVALARAADDDEAATPPPVSPPAELTTDEADADARMSSNFGCSLQEYQRKRSRSESIVSEGRTRADSVATEAGRPRTDSVVSEAESCSCSKSAEVDDDDAAAAAAAAQDKGMLFELANIHATIIQLEQRAELVEPLEQKIAALETRLGEAAEREARLTQELLRRPPADDEASDASRPRLVSVSEPHSAASAST